MNFVKGWKTVGFMGAIAVVGILQQADWATLVPPQYQGLALAIVGGLGVFLRMLTTTSIGAKQ